MEFSTDATSSAGFSLDHPRQGPQPLGDRARPSRMRNIELPHRMAIALRDSRARGGDQFANARQRENGSIIMNAELSRLAVTSGDVNLLDALAPAHLRNQPRHAGIRGIVYLRQHNKDVQAKLVAQSLFLRWSAWGTHDGAGRGAGDVLFVVEQSSIL